MSKFKVLNLNEYILTQLGIFSNQNSEKQSDVFFKSPRVCYILLISGSFIISSLSFAYRNSAQITVALRTYTFTLGSSQGFFMFICFGLNITKVRAVHLKLQEFVDKSLKGMAELLFIAIFYINCFTLMCLRKSTSLSIKPSTQFRVK